MKVGNVGTPGANIAPKAKVPAEKVRGEHSKVHSDEFVPKPKTDEVLTYTRSKTDADTIAKLRVESERAYGSLRQLVEQMLKRQGMTFQGITTDTTIEVDETARLEAQALIAEGGELSAEKVSDRIVEFAKSVSGGDKSKLASLKGAITEGFEAAAAVLGGELPEVSQRTYDLIMEKLDAWEQAE